MQHQCALCDTVWAEVGAFKTVPICESFPTALEINRKILHDPRRLLMPGIRARTACWRSRTNKNSAKGSIFGTTLHPGLFL
jgi:hypothetical protein